jgi:hypothetical protein
MVGDVTHGPYDRATKALEAYVKTEACQDDTAN